MKRITLFVLIAILFAPLTMAQEINGRYAIQNVQTGKNLRPYDAGSSNSNRIVLYNHVEWKCMTWDFISLKNSVYQLKNRFTGKTFQPSGKVVDGVTLVQQPLTKDSLQYWVFEKNDDNTYCIRLQGTDKYITLSSKETNSDIVLNAKDKKLMQNWRLVPQDPNF